MIEYSENTLVNNWNHQKMDMCKCVQSGDWNQM